MTLETELPDIKPKGDRLPEPSEDQYKKDMQSQDDEIKKLFDQINKIKDEKQKIFDRKKSRRE